MASKAKKGSTRTAQGGKRGQGKPRRTTTKAASQPVYAANGRVVGHIVGDTYHRYAKGSIHMLRAPRGWAIDADVLTALRASNVKSIQVADTESGTVYVSTLDTFERKGVSLNRGFGPQVALPVGYWTINGKPPSYAEKPAAPDGWRQLSLWADAA